MNLWDLAVRMPFIPVLLNTGATVTFGSKLAVRRFQLRIRMYPELPAALLPTSLRAFALSHRPWDMLTFLCSQVGLAAACIMQVHQVDPNDFNSQFQPGVTVPCPRNVYVITCQ